MNDNDERNPWRRTTSKDAAEDACHAPHRQAWDLIPWVVNETATEAERTLVSRHVAVCGDCRDELAFQRRLQEGIAMEGPPPHDAEPALARLLARIDDTGDSAAELALRFPTSRDSAHAGPRGRSRWTGFLAAAVVLQAVGLGALGGALWNRPMAGTEPRGQSGAAAAYDTLTRAPGPAHTAVIRLVPAPDLSLAAFRALLQRHALQVTQTNGDGTIFGVAPVDGATVTVPEAVTDLRREPAVLLAEPIVDR